MTSPDPATGAVPSDHAGDRVYSCADPVTRRSGLEAAARTARSGNLVVLPEALASVDATLATLGRSDISTCRGADAPGVRIAVVRGAAYTAQEIICRNREGRADCHGRNADGSPWDAHFIRKR